MKLPTQFSASQSFFTLEKSTSLLIPPFILPKVIRHVLPMHASPWPCSHGLPSRRWALRHICLWKHALYRGPQYYSRFVQQFHWRTLPGKLLRPDLV